MAEEYRFLPANASFGFLGLAVQAERALGGDFPVAEGGVGENLRLRSCLDLEVGVADA
jgi:hypothetical protein